MVLGYDPTTLIGIVRAVIAVASAILTVLAIL